MCLVRTVAGCLAVRGYRREHVLVVLLILVPNRLGTSPRWCKILPDATTRKFFGYGRITTEVWIARRWCRGEKVAGQQVVTVHDD
jgi:hypothetical protein